MLKTKITITVAVVAVAAVAASASEPVLKFLINDKVVSTGVVVIRGRSYIPVDDLARGLGATTTVTTQPGKGTTIDLSLPTQQAAKPEVARAIGSVNGIV